MRKTLGFILICALLTGCGSANTSQSTSPTPSPSASTSYLFETDPEILGPALQTYLNDLGKIGALENEVVGLFDAVSGTNFTNNAQLKKQLELIIPKAGAFLSKLKEITTTQPEITHFHEQYVSIWQQQTEAFEEMNAALIAEDQTTLEGAAGKIEIARARITPLQSELKALSEYAGIEIVF